MLNSIKNLIQLHPDIINSLFDHYWKNHTPETETDEKGLYETIINLKNDSTNSLLKVWYDEHKNQPVEKLRLGLKLIALIALGMQDLLTALSDEATPHPALFLNLLMGLNQLRDYQFKNQKVKIDCLVQLLGNKIARSGLTQQTQKYWNLLQKNGLISESDQILLTYRHSLEKDNVPVVPVPVWKNMIGFLSNSSDKRNVLRVFQIFPSLREPLNIAFPEDIMISSRFLHIFLHKGNGRVFVSGCNGRGQLGLGDYDDRKEFVSLDFQGLLQEGDTVEGFCTMMHATVMFTKKGDLLACGDNSSGQLGFGDKKTRKKFEKVAFQTAHKANKDQIKSICGGEKHILMLMESGQLLGCGDNSFGQLSLDPLEYLQVPKFTSRFSNLNIQDIFERDDQIKSVYCGNEYTIVLTDQSELWISGNIKKLLPDEKRRKFSKFTALELSNTFQENAIISLACGEEHLVILTEKGHLFGFGNNEYGQLGCGKIKNQKPDFIDLSNVLDDQEYVSAIYAGSWSTFILTNKNRLLSSGMNNVGQLGHNNTTTSYEFVPVDLTNNLRKNDSIGSVYCSSYHTFLHTTQGDVLMCGKNMMGELGADEITSKFTKISALNFLNQSKHKILYFSEDNEKKEHEKQVTLTLQDDKIEIDFSSSDVKERGRNNFDK